MIDIINRYKREPEANTNFCLQNQITELKAELEKIIDHQVNILKGD